MTKQCSRHQDTVEPVWGNGSLSSSVSCRRNISAATSHAPAMHHVSGVGYRLELMGWCRCWQVHTHAASSLGNVPEEETHGIVSSN